jgi:hypothetical protein
LRDALRKADEDIAVACPDAVPSDLPERLKAMQDRLWTMRATTTNLRAPLQAFHDSLTNEQKAQLDAPPASGGESRSGVPGNEPAALCYAAAQRVPTMADRSNCARRAAEQGSAGQPRDARRTLGADGSADDGLVSAAETGDAAGAARRYGRPPRHDVFLLTVNLAAALNDFYQSLSDEQKAKLDSLSL